MASAVSGYPVIVVAVFGSADYKDSIHWLGVNMPHRAHLRDDPAHDHPTRETTDHANLDPRRHPKHPKVSPGVHRGEARGQGSSRPPRRSTRAG